jgi:hypothetical protein
MQRAAAERRSATVQVKFVNHMQGNVAESL